MQHQKFGFSSLATLAQQLTTDGLQLPLCDHIHRLTTDLIIGGKVVPNRLVSQPVEGFDAATNGAPCTQTFERYSQLSKGGSGMIWMESISVSESGRSNPSQLWINAQNLNEFAELTQLIHNCSDTRPYVVAQLTHSGRFSAPKGVPAPLCAQGNPFIPKDCEQVASDNQLALLADDYLKAAQLAKKAGFDAVDIRCCHGYLLNELLGARNRTDSYGGSLENRARLLLDIVDRVRLQVGIEVAVRLNLFDAVPYPCGFGVAAQQPTQPELTEPIWLVHELVRRGVRLLNITAGVGAYSPQVIRPSDSGGEIYKSESPLEGVCRMLSLAHRVKQEAPDSVVVGSAFSWLRQFAPQAAAGCIEAGWIDLAGFGRLPICYPNYARDILSGAGLAPEQCCTTCNGCMAWIKSTGNPIKCMHIGKESPLWNR